jgi:hypothetical protein
MTTYKYVNANGHPHLMDTVGVCGADDSVLIDMYLNQEVSKKDESLGNTIVIYNTTAITFSPETNTKFRVKIKSLSK